MPSQLPSVKLLHLAGLSSRSTKLRSRTSLVRELKPLAPHAPEGLVRHAHVTHR